MTEFKNAAEQAVDLNSPAIKAIVGPRGHYAQYMKVDKSATDPKDGACLRIPGRDVYCWPPLPSANL